MLGPQGITRRRCQRAMRSGWLRCRVPPARSPGRRCASSTRLQWCTARRASAASTLACCPTSCRSAATGCSRSIQALRAEVATLQIASMAVSAAYCTLKPFASCILTPLAVRRCSPMPRSATMHTRLSRRSWTQRIDWGGAVQACHSVLNCASIAFCLASCTWANCSCIRVLSLCRQHCHGNGDCRRDIHEEVAKHLCKELALTVQERNLAAFVLQSVCTACNCPCGDYFLTTTTCHQAGCITHSAVEDADKAVKAQVRCRPASPSSHSRVAVWGSVDLGVALQLALRAQPPGNHEPKRRPCKQQHQAAATHERRLHLQAQLPCKATTQAALEQMHVSHIRLVSGQPQMPMNRRNNPPAGPLPVSTSPMLQRKQIGMTQLAV